MADLTLSVAQNLAGSLVTIGHPYQQAAINATAMDLLKWCKGAILDGRIWSAEQQAEALVEEARTTWDQWPEKGGTKQLLELFRTKYAPKPKAASASLEDRVPDMIARGILAAPCSHCPAGELFCEYGGARAHETAAQEEREARESAKRVTREGAKLTRKRPYTPVDLEQFIRGGKAVYEDEQRRKRQQLERVGITEVA
jgi:hypothetical protein